MKNTDKINPEKIKQNNTSKSIPGHDLGYEMTKPQKDVPQPGNHDGNEELLEKYNINDQAHLNSSKEDFVKTTSNFNHNK